MRDSLTERLVMDTGDGAGVDGSGQWSELTTRPSFDSTAQESRSLPRRSLLFI